MSVNQYEYLSGEEILPSNEQKIIEQAKFTYSSLRKAFEKQMKTIEDQGKTQFDVLKDSKDNREKLIKAIEVKSEHRNDQSTAADIFNDLI